ncbi:MAG TPA: sulfate reduction electron transfer complex DsrMKJOP subunit DsrM [Vicinamibacterales bacterium]|nr:sulfate reduction electron transfer complex DsrMKJOP subunit DsrM [Vicinamibacterales bacterium]
MKALYALLAVLGLAVVGWLGTGQPWLAGVIVPAVALGVFLAGFVHRVVRWGRAPVPFRITSVAGQQASLPWIERSPLDSPKNGREAALRVALDVLLFRSLFRNTRVRRGKGRMPVYSSQRLLWAAALAFHWSLLIVLVRHLRFFFEAPPAFLATVEQWDGFFQLTTPTLFVSDAVILGALVFLLGRRLVERPLRYLSLPADYFPLFLLLAVGISGIYMRYYGKVDLLAVKELTLGLATLQPRVPAGVDGMFMLHLFLVSVLLVYFPFSKLMHMGGIFLSPTRNLANDNRRRRHVNPWNPVVDVHTYDQWEEEFRDKLVAAGYTLDRGVSHGQNT